MWSAGPGQNGPLTIQSPFYPENGVCHLYLLHPPAGIVGGDRLKLTVSAEENSSVLLTTPGATKFYRDEWEAGSPGAVFFPSRTGLHLNGLPQETIYFPDANAQLSTTIRLEGSAQYLGWEINCLGLPANQKDFGSGRARIRLYVIRGGGFVLIESLYISNEKMPFQAAFLQNQPVFGTFIATGGYAGAARYPAGQNDPERIRSLGGNTRRGCDRYSLPWQFDDSGTKAVCRVMESASPCRFGKGGGAAPDLGHMTGYQRGQESRIIGR